MHRFIIRVIVSSLDGKLYACIMRFLHEPIVECMPTARILNTKHVGYIQVGSSIHLWIDRTFISESQYTRALYIVNLWY